jgi:hypothetical protein
MSNIFEEAAKVAAEKALISSLAKQKLFWRVVYRVCLKAAKRYE